MLLFALLLGLQTPAHIAAPKPPTALERAASLSSASGAPATATSRVGEERHSLEQILAAIRSVESGGHKEGGRHAVGDGGRAIGPYQIHRVHWLDARLAGKYEDCRDPQYARRVVIAYWKRWCPRALERCDAQVLARVHNGGPNGATKSSTLAYWDKVKRALARG